ncbi:hypothetical protein C2S53_015711 [Perilla frutescens var. hirtella]|uniref:Uncharacterized protein n=1 Tax=Perilla frutescens var. hirtella TaxID=608512 RepID=A0AAD4JP41_PERFH|nr:hypothetical protein C2S53_015711 [Perilla frutescens var. hirtella]
MLNGGQDFSSIFFQDDKVLSRLSSRRKRYNSKQREASFRVLYYGGATGSVPFLWESQPGTPKHKFSDSPLPPLTPPPQFQSSSRVSPTSRKKHSKIFNSIFARTTSSSKKISASPSPTSSSSSSSSYSSSYSLPSTPFHSGKDNSKARLSSINVSFGLNDDEYEPETDSPTSTLCFRLGNGGSSSRRAKGYYYPIKTVKKVVMSIAGRRISNNY